MWKPGQSGNPAGRPKNDIASEIARAIFSQNSELIYQAFGRALQGGNAYAFQVLADRGFGKLKESREVTHRYEDVSDDDLERRVNELVCDLGLAAQVDAVGADQGTPAGAGEAAK
jgi:hypothetical protein